VIVTGAAGGIGRAVAIRCARGGLVAVADLDGSGARRGADKARAAGGFAVSTAMDTISTPTPSAWSYEAIVAFRRLDVAVNSAGMIDGGGTDTPAPLHLATEG
jgi:L-rhamnose 1-dehydrogenase